jgi:hypothetical protein
MLERVLETFSPFNPHIVCHHILLPHLTFIVLVHLKCSLNCNRFFLIHWIKLQRNIYNNLLVIPWDGHFKNEIFIYTRE